MKRLNFFFLLAILAVGMTFVSCGDDDDDNNTIEVAPTLAEQYQGIYYGIDSLNVNDSTSSSWNAKTETQSGYTVVAHGNTIDLTIPQESYKELNYVGDITIGSYTIKDIAWDSEKNAFYRNYAQDSITCHFTSSAMSSVYPTGRDYVLSDASCEVTVRKDSEGRLHVDNAFKMIRQMPVTIYIHFVGTKN